MKKFLIFFSFAIALALCGTEYFVSNSGDDKAPGSRQQPFKTISKAAAVAKAGDIVTVRGGRYFEQLLVRNSGTPDKPIIFRGAPGETALLVGALPVTQKWQKVAGYRFIYQSVSPCEVNMLFDSRYLNRYMRVDTFEMLERQPGAYLLDKKSGKLYVNTYSGAHPDSVRLMIMPFWKGSARYVADAAARLLPVSGDTAKLYTFGKGVMITGSNIIWENFHMGFFPGQAIRVNTPAENVIIRNNTVFAGTCGIMLYGKIKNCKILNNKVFRVAGTGLMLRGVGERCLVKGNFVENCGTCSPFKEAPNGSEGNIFNISHYGHYQYTDIIDNIVIGTDKERCGRNMMRNKGAIRKHTTQTGNVFYGGGVDLSATEDGTALLANTTVIGGIINVKELRTEKKYIPVMKDNLCIQDMKQVHFADLYHYDFRQIPGSPSLGKGAFPKAANVLYVKPGARGNGAAPGTPCDPAAALSKGTGATIYMLPGVYSFNAALAGDVKIANYQGGKVTLKKSSLKGKGALQTDGITFEGTQISIRGEVSARRSCFVNSEVKAEKVILANTTLKSAKVFGRITLRNSLVLENGNTFTLAGIISENNCFTSQSALNAFQKEVSEGHKSFFRTLALDEDLKIPADSDLACAGLDCSAIGAGVAKGKVQELLVENLNWKQVSPDGVLISWSTPRHYCSVKADSILLPQNKKIDSAFSKQGDLRISYGEFLLRKFVPGSKYKVVLTFQPINGDPAVTKTLSFVMPTKFEHKPVTLKVGKSIPGAFRTIGEAVAKAGPGDTVIVEPGVYTESVPIYLSGITLKSRIPGKAVMNLANLLNYSIMTVNTSNVTIDGFRFTGMPYADTGKTVVARNAVNFTLRNCHFERRSNRGESNIHLFGSNPDGMLVENCIFDSGFHGVWAYPAKNVTIRNCTFYGCGVNAIHLGCEQGWKVEIYNNIFYDVVADHFSPAVTVAEHGTHIYCDYNIYWKTKRCPKQCYYAFGRFAPDNVYSAPWHIKRRDMPLTLAETRKRYGVEKNGFEADPKFANILKEDFTLRKDSPAIGKGKGGKNIGADVSVFK